MSHGIQTGRVITILLVFALAATGSALQEPAKTEFPRRLLLVTLDTTRADAIGAWGGSGVTPNLDRLASAGTRWQNALAPCPLTLPAHASLLTGLDPPEHGLRVNGEGALAAEVPSLAGVLASRGWSTGAFIGSRVLDRRFGLAHGFGHYDDRIAAERVGQYGYPERDAASVTDAALDWLGELSSDRDAFAWVHYYDPHAPYRAPGSDPDSPERTRYLDEVAWVDRQLGRLLGGLPGGAENWLIAVVGDHGEALGEHGEQTHGLFLYRGVLEVPLLLCGPNVAAGRAVAGPVAANRLALTLLRLLGVDNISLPGSSLPGIADTIEEKPAPVYAETLFPLAAYGWAPLTALTEGGWRYISAPRPELYHLQSDPGETRNVIADVPEIASRMREQVAALAARAAHHPTTVVADAAIGESLRVLGYLEGGPDEVCDGVDPKDGPALREAMDTARLEVQSGQAPAAAKRLDAVLQQNPSNPVAWSRLAEARAETGDLEGAAAARRRAALLRPSSEFSQLALGDAELRIGNRKAARAAWRKAVSLDPRYASAWARLAVLARQDGGTEAERSLLRESCVAGTASAALFMRLAALEESAEADRLFAAAVELLPEEPNPWLEWGRSLEGRQEFEEAETRYREASGRAPTDPRPEFALGRLLLTTGKPALARPHLQRAADLGRGTAVGAEAERLLHNP